MLVNKLMNKNYYQDNLSCERLRLIYELATPRIEQYLISEIDLIRSRLRSGLVVLELGCGYGRVLKELRYEGCELWGIDSAGDFVRSVREPGFHDITAAVMRAAKLGLSGESFDLVFAVQNGISAFKENHSELIGETLRVLKPGGKLLLSSYSDRIWPDRLEWFKRQSKAGLLGEIDYALTGNGRIVCRDGFTSDTVTALQFKALAELFEHPYDIFEIDESSLFLEITKS